MVLILFLFDYNPQKMTENHFFVPKGGQHALSAVLLVFLLTTIQVA